MVQSCIGPVGHSGFAKIIVMFLRMKAFLFELIMPSGNNVTNKQLSLTNEPNLTQCQPFLLIYELEINGCEKMK